MPHVQLPRTPFLSSAKPSELPIYTSTKSMPLLLSHPATIQCSSALHRSFETASIVFSSLLHPDKSHFLYCQSLPSLPTWKSLPSLPLLLGYLSATITFLLCSSAPNSSLMAFLWKEAPNLKILVLWDIALRRFNPERQAHNRCGGYSAR